jgi:hypothetical protein
MDSNGEIEILFGYSFANTHCKSLSNFPCIRSQEMESNNSPIIFFVDNKFSIAIYAFLII